MTEWTPEMALAKGMRIRDLLDARLEDIGVFDVMVQLYGKNKKGIRISIVNLEVPKKADGSVLTVIYKGNRLRKRSHINLASGPYGQAKRIIEGKNSWPNRSTAGTAKSS